MLYRALGLTRGDTVAQVLARHKGVGPGFDALRIGLALYIFYGHALWVAGGQSSVAGVAALGAGPAGATANALARTAAGADGFSGWTRPFHVAAVPLFFALSGFLVIGSAIRLRSTTTFLAFRFLRIFPALIVETVLCAVLLGGIATTLPLAGYYSDPLFLRYLGNMAGLISFNLPGVFLSNPVSGVVNANLWTLPSEFDCYAITAVLMATGVIGRRDLFTGVYAAVSAALIGSSLLFGFALTDGILSPVAITYYFFTGMLFFHWRDRVPVSPALFAAACAVSYLLLLDRRSAFVAPVAVTYAMAFVGMVAVPKLPWLSKGDYSYGIYLYGFPICQALVALFPASFVGHRYGLLCAGALAVSCWAALSWHLVEVHALKLKRHLPRRAFPRHGGAVEARILHRHAAGEDAADTRPV